jgi:hypothetical protein
VKLKVPLSEFPMSFAKYMEKVTVSPFADEDSEQFVDDC